MASSPRYAGFLTGEGAAGRLVGYRVSQGFFPLRDLRARIDIKEPHVYNQRRFQ